jgi:hypothetical protein
MGCRLILDTNILIRTSEETPAFRLGRNRISCGAGQGTAMRPQG